MNCKAGYCYMEIRHLSYARPSFSNQILYDALGAKVNSSYPYCNALTNFSSNILAIPPQKAEVYMQIAEKLSYLVIKIALHKYQLQLI